ncbi:MAG: CBS domain-containing protein [Candidatus Binatia bacterium]
MKVSDILQHKGTDVQRIGPDATIQEVLETLVEHRIGSLVVCNENRDVLGIITERDVLQQCVQKDEQVRQKPVREVMTTRLIVGTPDDDVQYVMNIMTHNRIRHLPIIVGHRLFGLISIGDVVKAQLEETKFENRYLREYISQ